MPRASNPGDSAGAMLAARVSIGELCGAMREVFGEYGGGAFF
jgi:hypothetical protein